MTINVRKAVNEDKQQAIYVEGKATPNLRYIERMWDDFTSKDNEPLFVAEIDNKIVGIGKFTLLPDNSAWLETLRVDSDYQGMGVGKAIYLYYLKQAKEVNAKALRMYTGVKNAASAGLAKLNGFTLANQFSGADLLIEEHNSVLEDTDFESVNEERALELLSPLKETWHNFFVFNRTFYKFTDELIKYLANNKFVYENKSGDIVVLGSRFMPERGLQLGLYHGDSKRCLDFAVAKANKESVSKINMMFVSKMERIKNELKNYGFVPLPSDCIVMEKI